MDITQKQIDKLWADQELQRKRMTKARNYYDGKSDITRRNALYSSGLKKSNVPTNWAKYIVDMYAGAMTDQPYQVVADDDKQASTADLYSDIATKADLDYVDLENIKAALIYGYALELHEFRDNAPAVIVERPERWALIRDENDAIVLAVTRFVMPENSLFRGEIMTKAMEIQYVYDAEKRSAYQRPKLGGEWQAIEEAPHFYGRVPIVETTVTDDRKPLLDDAVLAQIDEYEDIDSLSGDDIRHTSDAILLLKGVDPDWVKQQAELITSKRILPIPDDADASYLTRTTDTARIEDRLSRSREAIHIMGGVPDINDIVGATGGTSGIALQLKFMPMEQRAGGMVKGIRKGFRERIAVLNTMLEKSRETKIENYRLVVNFSMPINRIEEWQTIGMLNGIVSHQTQLELLSDIDDPTRELERVQGDMVATAEVERAMGSPEQQAAAQDLEVARAAPQISAQIETAIALIGDRILAAVNRR
jgi:SPP1 family phage portal protein